MTPASLPASVGEWTQASYEFNNRTGKNVIGNYDFGQFSNSYEYQRADQKASVSVDFPFTGGWHELSACYRSNGWTILDRTANEEQGHQFVATNFVDPDTELHGYLLFSNFNDRGETLTPPSGAILVRSWLFIRRRLLRKITGDLYQAQLFIASKTPLTEAEKAEAKALFFSSEKAVTSLISQSKIEPSA